MGSEKSEVRSGKWEVGSGKWEVGRPHRAFVGERPTVACQIPCQFL